MKFLIKIAFCTLAMSFCTTNFTMLRSLTRPTSQQTAQKTTQATRTFASKAPTTATTKTTNRLTTWWNAVKAQTGNAFTQLKNMFYSKAPTFTTPESADSTQQLSVPLSIPISKPEALNQPTNSTTDTQQFFESAFNEIIKSRKELNIDNQETNAIVCAPPGPELAWLLQIKSLEDMEHYSTKKRIEILGEYLTPQEMDDYLSTIKQNKKNIIEKYYTQSLPEEVKKVLGKYIKTLKNGTFDSTLSPLIQETMLQTLTDLGMNPESILIAHQLTLKKMQSIIPKILPNDNQMSDIISTILLLPSVILEAVKGTRAFVTDFNVTHENYQHTHLLIGFVNETDIKSDNLVKFVIAHEIGHLLHDHIGEKKLIIKMLERLPVEMKPKIKVIMKEFESLCELEADGAAARANPNIAKALYKELLQKINNPTLFEKIFLFSSDPHSKKTSPIHSSFKDKFHLFKTIHELHQENVTKQKSIQEQEKE